MADNRYSLRNIVVLVICVVWALNLMVMPLFVEEYQPTDLNPLIMAIIAALLIEKKSNGDSS